MFAQMRHLRPVLLAALVLAAPALFLRPSWARAVGLDAWNLSALREEIRTTDAETERMKAEDAEVVYRLRVKEAVVADLLGGRVTLAEVTERFLALNGSRPRCVAEIRDRYPGDTDRERTARHVIDCALHRVGPPERAAVAGRLEADFRQMFAAGAGR